MNLEDEAKLTDELENIEEHIKLTHELLGDYWEPLLSSIEEIIRFEEQLEGNTLMDRRFRRGNDYGWHTEIYKLSDVGTHLRDAKEICEYRIEDLEGFEDELKADIANLLPAGDIYELDNGEYICSNNGGLCAGNE